MRLIHGTIVSNKNRPCSPTHAAAAPVLSPSSSSELKLWTSQLSKTGQLNKEKDWTVLIREEDERKRRITSQPKGGLCGLQRCLQSSLQLVHESNGCRVIRRHNEDS